VLELAEVGDRFDPPRASTLGIARDRRLRAERLVRALIVVVADVFVENPLRMALAPHDPVIQAFAQDRPEDPLGVRVLKQRAVRGYDLLESYVAHVQTGAGPCHHMPLTHRPM